MAYTNAIFRIDLVNGSDAVRATLTPTAYADNGSGLVRVTLTSNTLVTGAVVTIAGTTGSVYAGVWKVTVINATTLDLIASTYSSNPAAKGTVVPFGGDSWTNAWLTINNGATSTRHQAGDEIRLSKSPAPSSIGSAKWTTQPDTVPVSRGITSSASSGGLIAITLTNHGYATGDIVYIQDHATALTANGVWLVTWVSVNVFTLDGSTWLANGTAGNATKCNRACVELSTPQTKTITRCEQIWTVAGTSTITREANDYKSGDASAKIVKASPSANTNYGYFATGLLDLSAYQKVSFWMKNSSTITNTANWRLCLCSDVAGAVIVDSIPFPVVASTGYWMPLTIARTGGGNLGNAIQSIALYSGATALATTGILLDNIIACTTSGLNLQSLISKNTLEQSADTSVGYADEPWLCIKNISQDGKLIFLDTNTSAYANANIALRIGYAGASETVTTYKRETFKTGFLTVAYATPNLSGTYGNLISYVGGYDTSDNKTGETFFDGLTGGYNFSTLSRMWNSYSYMALCRYSTGFNFSNASFCELPFISNINSCSTGINYSGSYFKNTTILNIQSNATGISGFTEYSVIDKIKNLVGQSSGGIMFSAFQSSTILLIENLLVNGYGLCIVATGSLNINSIGLSKWNNYLFYAYYGNRINVKSANIQDTSFYTEYNQSILYESFASISNYNSTGFAKIFTNDATIEQQASSLTNGSGKEWKLTILSFAYRKIYFPVRFPIAKIAVNAGSAITVKLFMKKSHATYIVASLVCKGYQIEGVDTDQVATKPNNTTEEEVTLTISAPSIAGVIEIEVQAYLAAGTTETVIFDKLTVTQ